MSKSKRQKWDKKFKQAAKPDFIINSQADCVMVDVANPYFDARYAASGGNPKKIKALVNMNESPAAHWLHKDIIDEGQYRAATKFRRLWEALGGKGAGAIDYERVKVDGGASGDPIDIGRMEAARELKAVSEVLGPGGYSLVADVCGACLPLGQLFIKDYERRKQSEKCQLMLQYLSEYWGYCTRSRMKAG